MFKSTSPRAVPFVVCIMLALGHNAPARGDNSVVIEPRVVLSGAQDVAVGILIANEVRYQAIVLPLEIRSINGAFIANSLVLSVPANSRLQKWEPPGAAFLIERLFAEKSVPSWPGAGTYCRPDDNGELWDTSATDVDFISPDAIMYVAIGADSSYIRAGGDGVPGASSPSLVLTFDVSQDTGRFEIDTTCVRPGNHFTVRDVNNNQLFGLTFSKATVQVVCSCPCLADPHCDSIQCDVLDVSAAINIAFRGFPSALIETCPVNGFAISRADMNCDGVTDVLDVAAVVNIAFRGASLSASSCDDVESHPCAGL